MVEAITLTIISALLGALISELVKFFLSRRDLEAQQEVSRTVEALRQAIVGEGDASIERIVELDRYLLRQPATLRSLTVDVVMVSALCGMFLMAMVWSVFDDESTPLSLLEGFAITGASFYGFYRLIKHSISQRNLYAEHRNEYLALWKIRVSNDASLPQIVENRKWLLLAAFFPLLVGPVYFLCLFLWFTLQL